jgi:hypothetical protein
MPFSVRQEGQCSDTLCWIGNNAFQQNLEMPRHQHDGGCVEKATVVFEHTGQSCGSLDDLKV